MTVGGIWAGNDEMAIGALEALDEAGLKPGAEVPVGGLNWSQDGLKEIIAGRMLLTDGGHFFVGAWAMALLRDLASGCDFAAGDATTVVFPTAAIFAPQAPQALRVIGAGDFAALDFRSYLAGSPAGCGKHEFALDRLQLSSAPHEN